MLLSLIRTFTVFTIFMMISFVAVLVLDTLFTKMGYPLSTFLENSMQILFVAWGIVKFGSKRDDTNESPELSAN